MTVVIVGGSLPFPPTAGNRIRTLNLLVRLAKNHRIIFLCHKNANTDEELQGIAYLNERGIETITVEHQVPSKSGVGFYARLAANLFSNLPYSIASHVSDSVRRAVDELASREKVDLWQAEGLPYFESLTHLTSARTMIMAHNVESLIWQRYYETEKQPLKRWYIGQQWRKFERFERKAFQAATRVVAVSEEDAILARERFGTDRIDVVDNGLDRQFFEEVVPAHEANRILFLGSLEWRPNLDAVGLLLDKIFPAVKQAIPEAKLWIVGRNPPESLSKRVQDLTDVELHANVADVRPYLARSALMAVPLRIGGGSRLKILEALGAGLPVVSTRVGAEGLRLISGTDLEIVEDESGLAPALIDLLRHPERAEMQASNGRRSVLGHYDWDSLAAKLEESWERCCHA